MDRNIYNVTLTKEQKIWFGDRMDENLTGAVRIPSYLYKKFRKITGSDSYKNYEIKSYLIYHCYWIRNKE